jgi:hypothetical protein
MNRSTLRKKIETYKITKDIVVDEKKENEK